MATKKSPATAPAKKTATKKAPAKATARKAPAATATKKAPAARKAPAKATTPAVKADSVKVNATKVNATKVNATKVNAAKAPAKKAPAKSPFDKKFLDSQLEMLLHERANYTRQAEELMAEAISLTENREPGDVQFDEESGEGDTLAVERERDLALSAQARAAIEEIDAAIGRIEIGTYGICTASGQPIPRERLKAIPWATERVEYKVGGFGRR